MAKQSKNQIKKHWRGVLRAQKKSGLGMAGFCRKNRIKPASLYAWRRRLAGPKAPKTRIHQAFIPVQVVGGSEDRPFLELVLKNGRVLRLYRAMPVTALAELVHTLEAEAC